jgi:hypothetical protein
MASTSDWPDVTEWAPSPEDVEHERQYWEALDRIAEYDAWTEAQAALESFESWALGDLFDELETVRTLTPDQEDIIDELVAEIERRGVAA